MIEDSIEPVECTKEVNGIINVRASQNYRETLVNSKYSLLSHNQLISAIKAKNIFVSSINYFIFLFFYKCKE